MPIYEFYCSRCHTIYNFLSKSANTEKIPLCPKCMNIPLARQMSVFAAISPGKSKDKAQDDPFSGLDEKKVERELKILAQEADKINDDDPRGAVKLMRKFSAMTGMKLGAGFQEALKRMERGEDPEKIEEEMGDILAEEDPFADKQSGKTLSRGRIRVDETLYEL
jgi:putative FmdB family regulatory protein